MDQRPSLSRSKKAFFSALTLLALFSGVEGILWLIGVKPSLVEEDPFMGFSTKVSTFIEKRDKESGERLLVTAGNKLDFFNRQIFSSNKSENTYRIFCVGGSTTFGRPYDHRTSFSGWLAKFLPAADSTRTWEVINCGGVSYASYRVALLMEELAHYEPDLFVIYTGHNEFLEDRTYGDMASDGGLVRSTRTTLLRTRTYSLLRRWILAMRSRSESSKKSLMSEKVKTRLDNSIGPEDYHRDESWKGQVINHFQYNLERMIALARTAGAEIVLITPAANHKDCTPFKSEWSADLEPEEQRLAQEELKQARDALLRGEKEKALADLTRATGRDGTHASLQFHLGQALLAEGHDSEAKAAFDRALAEDICPLRALPPIVKIVRDVAMTQRVPLVDFVQLAEKMSPHGIVGANLFLDHVHPTIEGHRLLALEMIQVLMDKGIAIASSDFGPAKVDDLTRELLGTIDSRSHGVALRNLSKVLGWAGKTEDALRLALEAVTLVPEDPEAHFQAGSHLLRQGELARGAEHLKKATLLNPGWLRGRYNYSVALMRLQRHEEAERELRQCLRIRADNVDALYLLGCALEKQGAWGNARRQFNKVLQKKPRHAKAAKALRRLEGREDPP